MTGSGCFHGICLCTGGFCFGTFSNAMYAANHVPSARCYTNVCFASMTGECVLLFEMIDTNSVKTTTAIRTLIQIYAKFETVSSFV